MTSKWIKGQRCNTCNKVYTSLPITCPICHGKLEQGEILVNPKWKWYKPSTWGRVLIQGYRQT